MAKLNANEAAFKLLTGQALSSEESTALRDALGLGAADTLQVVAVEGTTGASQVWSAGPQSGDPYSWRVRLNGASRLTLNNAGNINATSYSISGQVFVSGSFGNLTLAANNLDASAFPTSDPAVAGMAWNDSGTLKVSAG